MQLDVRKPRGLGDEWVRLWLQTVLKKYLSLSCPDGRKCFCSPPLTSSALKHLGPSEFLKSERDGWRCNIFDYIIEVSDSDFGRGTDYPEISRGFPPPFRDLLLLMALQSVSWSRHPRFSPSSRCSILQLRASYSHSVIRQHPFAIRFPSYASAFQQAFCIRNFLQDFISRFCPPKFLLRVQPTVILQHAHALSD